GLDIAGYDLTSSENAQAAVDAFSGLDSKLSKMYIVASSLPFIDYSRPGNFDTVPLSKLNIAVDGNYSLLPDFIAPSVQTDPVARIFDHIIMIPKAASTIALTTTTFEDGATVTVKKNNTNVGPWASNSFHVTNVSNGDVIHVKVISTDGSTASTYNLTVSKGDSRLNMLSIDGQTLVPVFSPMTSKYCFELDSSQDITINAKTIDPDVSVSIGAGLSSPAVVSTSNGVEIPITVTDGSLIRTITITPYIRGQEIPAGCKDILSANGFAYYLSNIVVQGNGTLALSPAFYYGTSEYSVTVPADVNNISLTLSTFTTEDVIISSSRNDELSTESNSKVLNIQDVVNGDRICVYALSADRSQGGNSYCININK
ncbi:MAG: cadherin-like beta sandwich domain-containing protein, partial [bacterium]